MRHKYILQVYLIVILPLKSKEIFLHISCAIKGLKSAQKSICMCLKPNESWLIWLYIEIIYNHKHPWNNIIILLLNDIRRPKISNKCTCTETTPLQSEFNSSNKYMIIVPAYCSDFLKTYYIIILFVLDLKHQINANLNLSNFLFHDIITQNYFLIICFIIRAKELSKNFGNLI